MARSAHSHIAGGKMKPNLIANFFKNAAPALFFGASRSLLAVALYILCVSAFSSPLWVTLLGQAYSQTPQPISKKLSTSATEKQATELFFQGMGFYQQRSYELATRYFFSALQKGYPSTQARHFLALSLYKNGDYQAARLQWQRLLSLYKQGPSSSQLGLQKTIDGAIKMLSQNTGPASSWPVLSYLKVGQYPAKPSSAYRLFLPMQISIDQASQTLYLLDYGLSEILETSLSGNLIRRIQAESYPFISYSIKKPLAFIRHPKTGNFFLSDALGHSIVEINQQGQLQRSIGEKGIGPGQLLFPHGLALVTSAQGGREHVWVADSGNSRISIFSPQGTWLQHIGRRGQLLGQFIYPSSIVHARHNSNLFVIDKQASRITRFDASGAVLDSFGQNFLQTPLAMKELSRPNSFLILDSRNLYFYDKTSDTPQAIPIRLVRPEFTYQENVRVASQASKLSSPSSSSKSIRILSAGPILPYTGFDIDKSGNLYLANNKDGRIEVFKPKQEVFKNLHVLVEDYSSSMFPRLHVDVRVRSSKGQPIAGLVASNFSVSVLDRVIQPAVEALPIKSSQRHFTVLLEAATSLGKAESRRLSVSRFLQTLSSNLKAEDTLRLAVFSPSSSLRPAALSSLAQKDSSTLNSLWTSDILQANLSAVIDMEASKLLLKTLAALRPTEAHLTNINPAAAPSAGKVLAQLTQPLAASIDKGGAGGAQIFMVLTEGSFDYSQFPNFLKLQRKLESRALPLYVIYMPTLKKQSQPGTASNQAQEVFSALAKQSGAVVFAYQDFTFRNFEQALNNSVTGRYRLYFKTKKIQLGYTRFIPLHVKVQYQAAANEDMLFGYVQPQ